MISQYHPPPTKTVGGGGRISREICRFFSFRTIIWRRGSPGRRCQSIGGDFEPYRISDYVLEGGSLKSIITWLLLGLLYGGFGLVAYHVLARRAEAGKGMPAYSVYSRERDGLAEFARLLEKLDYQGVPLTRPIQQTRARGLLILVEPHRTALLPGEP